MVVAILVVIGGGVWYVYNAYIAGNRWKPILQQELKDLVLRSSDSLYHIEYSDFDLNLASGNASLYDFKLIPDMSVYDRLLKLKKAPDNVFTLSVKKLLIKNVGAKKAYREKILDIDDITIDKPSLTIVNKRMPFNDTVKVGKPKTPYQVLSKVFKKLHIDSIALKDISLNYVNKNGPVVQTTTLNNIDISISDILIDSLSSKDPARFYYTKDVNVTVHDYHLTTPDKLYEAKVKKMFFSTAQRVIQLNDVSFLPNYNRTDFYRVTGKSGDIYSLKFKKIDVNDLDLQDLLRVQSVYAGNVNIKGADVSIYSNNAFKGKKSSKIGKDPQQALQKLSLDLWVKRININNARISYSETDATTNATGEILFTHTNGTFFNVTNDDDQKRRNPYMRAAVATRFMDAAPFNVNFKFNLAAKDGAFNYNGELGAFDGRILDKLVKPLAMVHVKSADVDKLDFNVDASNYAGKGNLQFYYRNLNIQLLKKVAGTNVLQDQGFLSKVANTLIIDNNNPGKDGVLRQGPIDLAREPDVSFFSFLYKALLDGLKPSVGYTKKTEGQVNVAITKVSNLVSKIKQFEEDRKQRRQERRAKKDSLKKLKQNSGE